MKNALNKHISSIVSYVEVAIAIIILIALLLGIVGLVLDMGIFRGDPFNYENFSEFLANAFSLVIGIEFIKMLVKHTPGSVVEVLLFAIARGLIVEHAETWETLIGIVAIALVFAIRKYLFINSFEEKEHAIFAGEMSVRKANAIAMVRIPHCDGDTLSSVIRRELEHQNKSLAEDSLVNFAHVTLRIAQLHEGKIEKVEVIRVHH